VEQDNLIGLRASALTGDDVEGDWLALAQGFIAGALYGGVVGEDIGATIVAAEKAVAFGVIEPPYSSGVL